MKFPLARRSRSALATTALLALFAAGCRRPVSAPESKAPAPASPAPKSVAPAPVRAKATPEPRVVSTSEGVATWYDPSEDSRVAQRAPGELTAASDRLPMGSTVRVTNLKNDRQVLVRITDRGVNRRHAIDLCKDAADAIGLAGKGEAKVRIEVLADADHVPADPRP